MPGTARSEPWPNSSCTVATTKSVGQFGWLEAKAAEDTAPYTDLAQLGLQSFTTNLRGLLNPEGIAPSSPSHPGKPDGIWLNLEEVV